jgi:hypothetical protein
MNINVSIHGGQIIMHLVAFSLCCLALDALPSTPSGSNDDLANSESAMDSLLRQPNDALAGMAANDLFGISTQAFDDLLSKIYDGAFCSQKETGAGLLECKLSVWNIRRTSNAPDERSSLCNSIVQTEMATPAWRGGYNCNTAQGKFSITITKRIWNISTAKVGNGRSESTMSNREKSSQDEICGEFRIDWRNSSGFEKRFAPYDSFSEE